MPIQPCRTPDDVTALLAASREAPVVVLKHSTRCPISAQALAQVERFAEGETACWMVLVVEDRPLSLALADRLGVAHTSPQALVIYQERVTWHEAHWRITEGALISVVLEATAA